MEVFKLNSETSKFSIHEESIIEDAINCLNKSSLKIVLVTGINQKFVGTISDGDIRRGLLKGVNISDKINSIINKKPTFVTKNNHSQEDLKKIVKNYGLHQIPLLDKKKQILGLYEFGISANVDVVTTPFIIMAGGRGHRLMPFTENTPKPLLEVNGKPIIEHIILNAKSQGFINFYISIFYLSQKIKDYLGNGERLNININYIEESRPLGTIGSIKKIQENLNGTFIVTNGDLLTNIEYKSLINFHKTEKAEASMAIRSISVQNKYGVVKLDGLKISGFEEKPVDKININAGIYIFEPSVVKYIKKNERLDTPQLFDRIRNIDKKIIAYPIYEGWQDIGTPEDLDQHK